MIFSPFHRTASLGVFHRFGLWAVFALAISLATAESAEIVLEQIISREHAAFRCAPASLNVGRDHMVYLCSGGEPSYVLRLSRDGKQKYGLPIVYAASNATANAAGIVASANGHFAHKIVFYDKKFMQIAEQADFLVNDQVGWDAPAEVEVGASGDFYGIDQHRNRILRLDSRGKILKVYNIPREPPPPQGQVENLRVCEKKEMFFVLSRGGGIRSVAFDGKTRWQVAAPLAGQWYLRSRAFDCDDEGNLYVLENQSETIKKFTADGKPGGEIKLAIADRRPPPDKVWFFALRIAEGDVIIRREHATELFQVYDLATGAFKTAVHTNCEILRAKYQAPIWTAGQTLPFRVEFETPDKNIAPRWRLWARPLEAPDYEEWGLEKDGAAVPPSAAGLYRIKLTPEVAPLEQGLDAQIDSEYLVQTVVEVRAPAADGSLTVFTPDNRIYFSQGESIAVAVAAKSGQRGEIPVVVTLRYGKTRVAEQKISCPAGGQPAVWYLTPAFTAALRPGGYLLTAEAEKFTCTPQRLFIGPTWQDPVFFFVQYGDYDIIYPAKASIWNIADAMAAHSRRLGLLGINLAVDRLGWWNIANPTSWDNHSLAVMSELSKRLESDQLAPHPAKAKILFPFPHALAAYGQAGIRQMGILMGNDAGLPLGTGFDNRKPEQILECLQKVTEIAGSFPAFRGWSWASNWWVFDKRGAAAAKDAAERASYEAALKEAQESGKWAAILDKVSDYRLGMAVEAQGLFNRKLKEMAPDSGYRTAVAAPYRNVEAYPPTTFANVDEVDLHIQWEQMAVPYHAPHNVDFYKRPGKRGWAHPEIWNDDGTGGQVLPILFQLAMRGADGVGFSGKCPPWAIGAGLADDPRVGHYGYASVVRAFGSILRAYGMLWARLENDDQIAIAASGRMYKIDRWGAHVMGLHFARQMEAYITCLHAHRPARYVFAEEVTPETFKRYAAVLLVDERVEIEPQLMAALRAAQAGGVSVFYDQTCRAELFREFTPLGLAFDKLEKDRSPAGDDAAYWRFQNYAKANLAAFNQALAKIKPAAAAEDDAVLTSVRRAERGRYLWVVNNTQPRLEPAQLWRMNLSVTTRVPFICGVALAAPEAAVYDVFAMQKAKVENGKIHADLRSLPCRFYALLPEEIAAVELKTPAAVRAGQALAWQAAVMADSGKPLAALIPLRLRLTDKNGGGIYEEFHVCGSQPAQGAMMAPWGATGPLTLEAVEMFSGKKAAAVIQITAAPLPMLLAKASASPAPTPQPAPADKSAKGSALDENSEPVEKSIGPHCRDLAILANGKTAVINTMNWDHNLYAIDLDTGQTRWRQRLGHYFAFAPQALRSGLAVQGFDFNSAYGYHLYLLGDEGKAERRFALYGLPKRLPFRFVPGLLCEERQGMNGINNNFAVPPEGSWVATAGDLGLAVWDRSGKLLWKREWYKTNRQPAFLAALSEKTLLAVENLVAVFYEAESGAQKAELPLAATGMVKKISLSADGKTAAVAATSESGLIFILRSDRIERIFPTPAEDICLSADGEYLAVAVGNRLKLYSLANGLQWSYAADDRVRFPRFAPGGKRLAFSTDLGSVAVVAIDGAILWEGDLGSRPALAWLPDGDLLAATWMGKVMRFGGDFKTKWQTLLCPEALDMRDKLLADDGVPTVKADGWSNAEVEALPIAPNLLSADPVICRLVPSGDWGGAAQLSMDPQILWDGKDDPPSQPWIDWSHVGFFAETSPVNYLLLDAFRKRLRVEAITFFEDPAHPESWLRDAKFEYWDAAAEKWVTACDLLADAAVHTHKLPQPAEAARFRILLPWGCVGNLRLAEIVFHGKALGCSHPDAAAGKPVAVLFDEHDDIKHALMYGNNGLSFKMDEAYSGGRSLALSSSCRAVPLWQPPFGHVVPNWDFEIVEKPAPGQYRWLQFAWKALSPNTRGISVRIAGVVCHAGEYARISEQGETPKKLADKPPLEWKVERVDLWEAAGKKNVRVQDIGLAAVGDGALVDQILLAASPQALDSAAAGASQSGKAGKAVGKQPDGR